MSQAAGVMTRWCLGMRTDVIRLLGSARRWCGWGRGGSVCMGVGDGVRWGGCAAGGGVAAAFVWEHLQS